MAKRSKNNNEEFDSEAEAYSLMTPDGHNVPGVLRPGVSLDAVQRFIEVERARNRRALLWIGTVFLFASFLILALFISVGIFVLRNSARATEIVGDIQMRTALVGVELIGVSNELSRLQHDSSAVRRSLDEKEQARRREQRIMQHELERFSRWVAQRTGSGDERISPLLDRFAMLEAKIAERDAEIEALREEYEALKKTDVTAVAAPEPVVVEEPPQVTETVAPVIMAPEPVVAVDPEKGETPPEPAVVAVGDLDVFSWDAIADVRMPDRALLGHVSLVVFPNGDRYEGQFREGLFDGWGVFQYANGDRYEGEFKGDLKHGRGMFLGRNGERYEGQYAQDVRQGIGRLIMPDGDRYVGEFRNGKVSGRGTFLYANGNRYSGDVLNGQRHGKGTFYFENGDIYTGEFRQDERHGQGTYEFADGGRYVGEFRNGLRHGHGRYVFPDGSEYAGSFRDGLKDGTGVFVFEDGTRVRGLWKDDRFVQAIDG